MIASTSEEAKVDTHLVSMVVERWTEMGHTQFCSLVVRRHLRDGLP